MSTQAYHKASESEKLNFVQCGQCGEMVDSRQTDEVLCHATLSHTARHVTQQYTSYGEGARVSPVKSITPKRRYLTRVGLTVVAVIVGPLYFTLMCVLALCASVNEPDEELDCAREPLYWWKRKWTGQDS